MCVRLSWLTSCGERVSLRGFRHPLMFSRGVLSLPSADLAVLSATQAKDEKIWSSALSGTFYAFFAGQPLCIMGATGPELAYTLVFYEMCKYLGYELMAARFGTGMWCALMGFFLVLSESRQRGYITQFTSNFSAFSPLYSWQFIIDHPGRLGW